MGYRRGGEGVSRIFDVRLEGQTMLNDYDIFSDRARIDTSFSSIEHDSVPVGMNTGIVKRFEIDVTGGNGLQIDLIKEVNSTLDPILSAVRILKADPPRIDNVVLKGSTWATGVDYSFDQLVGLGQQLRPIATGDVDILEIHFDGPVDVAESDLLLAQTIRQSDGLVVNSTLDQDDFSFAYDPVNYIGTWTFNSPLPDGKFAIHLTGVTGGAGQALDVNWENDSENDREVNPTWAPPENPQLLLTGDGVIDENDTEFRFHFALLAGDTDGDGYVSSTNMLPLRAVGGADFSDDDIVDAADLAAWQASYGIDNGGDADGDGDTDGRDFLIWQRKINQESAWYIEPSGSGSQPITIDAPPQVLNVIVSGSQSTHAPFSFDTVDGSGSQLATVPVGLADTISIVFSEDVDVVDSSLVVVGLTTANVPELADFSYDPLTFTATWRFEGWAWGDNYLLYVHDTILDPDENRLDGEWTNPASITTTNSLVSTFPSGDGEAGGGFLFTMTLLPGDANRDNIVNMSDWYIISANMAPSGIQKLFTQGDFNGDGVVNGTDAQMFSSHSGTNLQTPWILADLDEDGDVDDDDLAIIESNSGMTGADWEDGDLNGDSIVDETDLDLAFAQYGLWLSSVA